MITLNNITKNYESKYVKTEVLQNINFVVNNNSIVAITGTSGSGKSTLLNIMCGLDKPTSGEVLHDDMDITRLSRAKLSEFRLNNCGFVFQDFQLVSTLSVKENIYMPALAKSKKIDEKWYIDVLKMMELEGKENAFSHQLSGGEKQRVAIARAIMTKPKVIFADEPTGNLDKDNTNRIMKYLVSYAKKYECIFVYVTHEHELCSLADVVVSVEDKQVKIIK